MGNTCKRMAVSFQCMTKFTTNKINKKKNKKDDAPTDIRKESIENSGFRSTAIGRKKSLEGFYSRYVLAKESTNKNKSVEIIQ